MPTYQHLQDAARYIFAVGECWINEQRVFILYAGAGSYAEWLQIADWYDKITYLTITFWLTEFSF